ncbi:MAG: hypothetical protein QXJ06_01630 [Candidatus Aenigmatarchaeota archaeon]
MKASSILTFTIIFFIEFILLSFIIFISYNYYNKSKNVLIEQSVNQIVYELISNIADIYDIGSKTNNFFVNETMIILEKKINLPEKIAGENYYIEGISNTGIWNYIKINDTYNEEIFGNKIGIIFRDKKYYFDIPNIQANLAGKVKSGKIKITFVKYRYENNFRNAIIFGDFDTIIDIYELQ